MYTLNANAIVAAEMITATREPSSDRLYQLIRAKTSGGSCFMQAARVDVQKTHHCTVSGQEANLELQPTITIPHMNTIKGSHLDGRKYFRARLLGTYDWTSVYIFRSDEKHLTSNRA
jgi:hypothetical protein